MIDTNAVLFDLDGTLLDTARDLGGALNRLLQEEGKPPLPYDQYRNAVSNGGNALVSLGFGTTRGDEDHARLYHRLLDLYAQTLAEHTQPFPGIREILPRLAAQDICWGIVTNKPRRFSDPLLDIIGLSPAHAVLVCADDVTNTKPHPEPLLLAAATLELDPAHVIYVGDHLRDIDAGKAAGMRSVAVRYGYIEPHDSADNWRADYVIDTPLELLDIIK